jgi:hypothetical protein
MSEGILIMFNLSSVRKRGKGLESEASTREEKTIHFYRSKYSKTTTIHSS